MKSAFLFFVALSTIINTSHGVCVNYTKSSQCDHRADMLCVENGGTLRFDYYDYFTPKCESQQTASKWTLTDANNTKLVYTGYGDICKSITREKSGEKYVSVDCGLPGPRLNFKLYEGDTCKGKVIKSEVDVPSRSCIPDNLSNSSEYIVCDTPFNKSRWSYSLFRGTDCSGDAVNSVEDYGLECQSTKKPFFPTSLQIDCGAYKMPVPKACVTLYRTKDCSGEPIAAGCHRNSTCFSYGQATCQSTTPKTAEWELDLYEFEKDCDGDPNTLSGTGLQCVGPSFDGLYATVSCVEEP
eukprot:m.338224 g.338224  ORF g.338224 m.338224 type:complete len:297 (+) comp18348_c0_seq1:147-1037(+)